MPRGLILFPEQDREQRLAEEAAAQFKREQRKAKKKRQKENRRQREREGIGLAPAVGTFEAGVSYDLRISQRIIPRSQSFNESSLRCPQCNAVANVRHTQYGERHHCTPCGLWSWGGKPLVSAGTHAARKEAHTAFDRLWQGSRLSRGAAYRLLERKLGIPREQCHMSVMDEATALRVPQAVAEIIQELEQGDKNVRAENGQ